MNIVNQNGKLPKETLAGSNSDVKTILRGPQNFKMPLSLLKVLEKPLIIPLSLCHMK